MRFAFTISYKPEWSGSAVQGVGLRGISHPACLPRSQHGPMAGEWSAVAVKVFSLGVVSVGK